VNVDTHQSVSVLDRHLGMVIPNSRQLLRRRNRSRTRREFRKRRSGISGESPRVGVRPGSTVPEARERFVGEGAHGGRKSKGLRGSEDVRVGTVNLGLARGSWYPYLGFVSVGGMIFRWRDDRVQVERFSERCRRHEWRSLRVRTRVDSLSGLA
jgi:hypothetical protein